MRRAGCGQLVQPLGDAQRDYQNNEYHKDGPIAYLTLNRPEKVNALSDDLQVEVRDALEDAGWGDDAIRVIVLRANGRAFSAGFDIGGAGGGAPSDAHTIRRRFMHGKGFRASAWWDAFWNNPKPIIAQVHGFCIAGGCATASFCDLRIAADDAMFGASAHRPGAALRTDLPAVSVRRLTQCWRKLAHQLGCIEDEVGLVVGRGGADRPGVGLVGVGHEVV